MSLMSDFKTIEADIDAVVAIAKDVSGIVADGKTRFAAARDALKAGLADAIASVESMAAKAKSTAASTEKAVEDAAGEVDAPKSDPAPQPEPEAPAPVVDLAAGTTVHTAADGIVTTLDHDVATITAKDDEGTPVVPHPDDVKAVVQATVDAGVAVPEAVAADAGVTVAAPEAAPVI